MSSISGEMLKLAAARIVLRKMRSLYFMQKKAQSGGAKSRWRPPTESKANNGIVNTQDTNTRSIIDSAFVGGAPAFSRALDRAQSNTAAYPTSYVPPGDMTTMLSRLRAGTPVSINNASSRGGFSGTGSSPYNITGGTIGPLVDRTHGRINPYDYLLHESTHAATSMPSTGYSWHPERTPYPSTPNITRENAREYYTSPSEAIPQLMGAINNIRRDAYNGKLSDSYGAITKQMQTPEGMASILRDNLPQNSYYQRYIDDPNFINLAMQIPH